MAEKEHSESKKEKEFDPDQRFKYIGFEVLPGKIKDLFKSEAEKEIWVKRLREKRQSGSRAREHSTLEEPRVAGYEKIVLTITSLLLVFSLFLPWFSGYQEFEIEAAVSETQEALVSDSLGAEMPADSAAIAAAGTETDSSEAPLLPELAGEVESVEGLAETATEEAADEIEMVQLEKDEHGFASITGPRKRKEIRRDHQSISAIGVFGAIGALGGKVFSSGFVLMLTGFLFIIYMLACIGLAVYTIYTLYGAKGSPDDKALQLKKVLKLNWISIGIWAFCLVISFVGASYSFDSTGMLKQIGTGYGTGAYLGLLAYGFYISLACFIMNAVKAIEI